MPQIEIISPQSRWPTEFAEIGAYAERLGFGHVESGPLVRSSYHAKRARDAADSPVVTLGTQTVA